MRTIPANEADAAESIELCAICGKDAGNVPFSHIYVEGRRIMLCSPACAQIFLHPPGAERNGYDDDAVSPVEQPGNSKRWGR